MDTSIKNLAQTTLTANQASNPDWSKVFLTPDVRSKIILFDEECQLALSGKNFLVPAVPSRPPTTYQVPKEELDKPGITTTRGQAWLLHDLANIELQAAELFLRGLHDFPDASPDFRHELGELCLEEVGHLNLCLQGLENLGYQWGDFPIHLGLWQTVSPIDTLIDRLFTVHLYLEASGLDSAEQLLRRLQAVPQSWATQTVKTIAQDEVRHVNFGTKWFKILGHRQQPNTDLDELFDSCLNRLKGRLPPRGARVSENLRRLAGMSDAQIQAIKNHQLSNKSALRR